jgi:hypothetical protein
MMDATSFSDTFASFSPSRIMSCVKSCTVGEVGWRMMEEWKIRESSEGGSEANGRECGGGVRGKEWKECGEKR